MLTQKQALNVLYHPQNYTKEERSEAVKIGIVMLDKMAEADNSKMRMFVTTDQLPTGVPCSHPGCGQHICYL